jgi:predicted O-methyltransferase YrrM
MTSVPASRSDALRDAASETTGFLSLDEGEALLAAATHAATARLGPLLEIGSYLGRSTLFLAAGIAAAGTSTVLYSIDHHHGSEEMQAGWPDHDASLIEEATGKMDSLPRWRQRIEACNADDLVIGVIGSSARVAENWSTMLSLVFIDGGHGREIEWADYQGWSPKLAPGGLLAIHDVFADPADGGRPPYECYLDALASGRFVEAGDYAADSLRVLVATAPALLVSRTRASKRSAATPPPITSAAMTTAAEE